MIDLDKMEQEFKEIYHKWEAMAKLGDERATRQVLIDSLIKNVDAHLRDARAKIMSIKEGPDEPPKISGRY